MRRTLFFLSSIFVTGIACFAQHPVFRWDVKTITDDSGIDWLEKLEATRDNKLASIEGLTTKPIAFNSCHNVGKNTRRSDEKRVVKLQIQLVKVKKEDNDNDFHIVMQSLTSPKNKMVAEIPDPGIEEYAGDEFKEFREMFARLRTKVEELLQAHVTESFKDFPANTIVTIYGVPFYDCKHGSNVVGASKNFRELHPVMEIEE